MTMRPPSGVGDLVTVHVMDNDISPSGLPISVDPDPSVQRHGRPR
jgi:hypothetical protein